MPKPEGAPRFAGFETPRYTPIPDQLLDFLLADLSGAELKVLLYIMRRTFGWKKDADAIGLKQLTGGITARDGRVVDVGTGLAKSSVVAAIKSLEEWGLIERQENHDDDGANLPTTYRVRLSNTGGTENRTTRLPIIERSRVRPSDPQETPDPRNNQEIDDDDHFIRTVTRRHGLTRQTAERLAAEHRDADGKLRRVEFEGRCYQVAQTARQMRG